MKIFIVLLIVSFTGLTLAKDNIAFVFEMTRHGARSPLKEDLPGYFQVLPGMLTTSGMRQRHLLGSINREKYIENYKLLDEEYNPSQIYVQSTNLFRTLQSAYSELIGMYPPNKTSNQITEKQIQNLLNENKGNPPIKIRMNKQINENIGKSAMTQGSVLIPVFNYDEYNINDNLNYNGCPYAEDMSKYYNNVETIYSDIKDQFISIVQPIQKAFDLPLDPPESMLFNQIGSYCDTLLQERFEGCPARYNFTEEDLLLMRKSQVYYVTRKFQQSSNSQSLVVSKELQDTFKLIEQKVNIIIQGKEQRNDLKYVLHSIHDTQISNTLLAIQPSNFTIVNVSLSSQIIFELHYDSDCLEEKRDQSCFQMYTLFNGTPLKFEPCVNQDVEYCTYEEFKNHMDKVLIREDQIVVQCLYQFNP